MERISSGIAELDELLGGGIPQGSTILVVGRPGAGKTILAHHMMFHNAAPDCKAIYFTTLAEPQVKVLRFQQEFSYFNHDMVQKCVIYQDLGSVLRRHGPKQVLNVIGEALREHQPRLMIVDTIKTVADMLPGMMEFREFLLDLTLRMATWNCTTLLLGEYSEEEIEIRPESYIADGIIYLYGTEEKRQQKRYLRILKMRGTSYRAGENLFRITTRGIDMFPRLNPVVSEQVYGQFQERLSTGIPALDEMMAGGIPRASTTLISGSSGTGKTILAVHFAYAGLASGEKVIYLTFEENLEQIIGGALDLGIDLRPFREAGQFHGLHVSPIEVDVDELVFTIKELLDKTGASRLVIDSISSFEVGMRDKVKYTDYIWALTDYVKTIGASVLLTHEMEGSGQLSKLTKHGISYLADNLLLINYLQRGQEYKRYLRVVKMRRSYHVKIPCELLITAGGLALEPSSE